MLKKFRVYYELKVPTHFTESQGFRTNEIVEAQNENTAKEIIKTKYSKYNVEIQVVFEVA